MSDGKKLKVVVSHPGKQHVHRLVYALQKIALHLFFTTVWDTKETKVRWIKKIFPFTRATFKKRGFDLLETGKIKTHILPELIRLFLSLVWPSKTDRWIFMVDRWHDRYVCKQLSNIQYDILIGFENASYLSFKKAKELGKITVLDLAQVHHNLINDLRSKYEELREVVKSNKQFEKTNRLKTLQNEFVDFFFTISELSKASLIAAGIPENRIYKINLGFDPNAFSLKNTYRKDGRFDVLFVGTITRRKGVKMLIQIFKELGLRNSFLTMVGPTSDAKDLLIDLPSNVRHIPFTDHADLLRFYQEADVFVLPSYLDSWAMVVLEAMACGTPVIVSDNTGAKDAVLKGGGFVFPTGDKTALGERIAFFYYNRSQVELLGRRAHEIASEYTWDRYDDNIASVLKDIQERSSNT